MKIIVSGPATAVDAGGRRVTGRDQLKALHGLSFVQAKIADHIGAPFDEFIEGGWLRLVFDREYEALRVEAAFRSTRKLQLLETRDLIELTRAQWAGDLGRQAFAALKEKTGIHIDLAPDLPAGGKYAQITAIQSDDGFDMPAIVLPMPVLAARGYLDQVRQCLQKGHDINARDPDGHTALSAAIHHRHGDTAVYLIDQGADPGPAGPDHRGAIHEAAFQGLSEVVRALLRRGESVDTPCTSAVEPGMTPIMFAAMGGHLGTIQLLHAAGANLECQSLEGPRGPGRTLLMCAHPEHFEVIQWLLDHGADPRLCNAQGMTASEAVREEAVALEADPQNAQMIRALLTKAELLAKYEAVPLE